MTEQPEGRALTMAEINARLRANRCSPACSEQHTYVAPCQVTYRNYREQPFCQPCADGKPPACTHCGGDGYDPEDPGDYDPAVHQHNPSTRQPCPECVQKGLPPRPARAIADAFNVPLHLIDTRQPAEHCGATLPAFERAPVTECVLRPGHQGSHANHDGARWIETSAAGYCPHCGRGDAGPTADQYEQQRQRAEKAEAALARIRDAVALHRQGLISVHELDAVVGRSAPDA